MKSAKSIDNADIEVIAHLVPAIPSDRKKKAKFFTNFKFLWQSTGEHTTANGPSSREMI